MISMKRNIAFIAVTILLISFASTGMSHSGRTNSEGCHNNRKTGDYHCHDSGSKALKAKPIYPTYSQSDCLVIGNTSSKIFHVPGGNFYRRMLVKNRGTDNRRCFQNKQTAIDAGYRASKR